MGKIICPTCGCYHEATPGLACPKWTSGRNYTPESPPVTIPVATIKRIIEDLRNPSCGPAWQDALDAVARVLDIYVDIMEAEL